MNEEITGYTIQDTLSESGNSVVYRAIREVDECSVIIKSSAKEYPSAADLSRSKLEYDFLSQMEIPGVISVHGFERRGNTPFIFMEDFSATDLSILKHRGMPLPLFFDIAVQIVEALQAIHQQKIVHRDICPKNILFHLETQQIKIIDFSIATELGEEIENIIPHSSLDGSIEYISPEQTGRMNRAVDYRTDFYSLGVTFYELLTDTLPFEADDILGFVHCHISKRPKSPSNIKPQIPQMLSEIVLKLLNKDPWDRYQSAHGLLHDLRVAQKEYEVSNTISSFKLATSDLSPLFRISDKLYGREGELNALLETFERSAKGRGELAFVSGNSGFGKSTMVHELQMPVVRRNGHFISGKFSVLDKHTPYLGISRALDAFISQVLTESEKRVASWQSSLMNTLGTDARLLLDVVPTLGKLLSELPLAPPIEAKESQNRLNKAVVHFLQVFASPDHPVVLFLDDLQWGDSSSLDLLTVLVESDIDNCLIIVSFRNEEGELSDNVLSCSENMRQLRKQKGLPLTELVLEPLTEDSVNRMLADTFYKSFEECRALSGSIYKKAAGHPLYTLEILRALHQKGIIRFSQNEGAWEWDLSSVDKLSVSENVVGLLMSRMDQLSETTRELLVYASLLGSHFSLEVLAQVAHQDCSATAEQLIPAAKKGVITPLSKDYRLLGYGASDSGCKEDVTFKFSHDRIYQTIYDLIPQSELAKRHYDVGKTLLSLERNENGNTVNFEPVNQLNLGLEAIDSDGALWVLGELNLETGRRADQACAYSVAIECYRQGLRAIHRMTSMPDSSIEFELLKSQAFALYVSGHPDEALVICDSVLMTPHNELDRAGVYLLKSTILEHLARLDDAIEMIRCGLALLDFELPSKPEIIGTRIDEGINSMQAHIRNHSVQSLSSLPEMVDPDKLLVMEMLYRVVPSAHQVNPRLFVLIELLMFDLAVTNGLSPFHSKNFMDCAIIQGSILGDYASGLELSKVAFQVLGRFGDVRLKSGVEFVYATYVAHWHLPFAAVFKHFDNAISFGMETGDVPHAFYGLGHRTLGYFYSGRPLPECLEDATASLERLNTAKAVGQATMARSIRLAIQLLRNDVSDTEEQAARHIQEEMHISKNTDSSFLLGTSMAKVSFIHDDYQASSDWSTFAKSLKEAGKGYIHETDHFLFCALSILQVWESLNEVEKKQSVEMLDESDRRLRHCSENIQSNYAFKYHLLAAERARVNGEPLETILGYYREAEECIASGELIQYKAIINELVGRHLLALGLVTAGQAYIKKSFTLFKKWGAVKKLEIMMERYPDCGLKIAKRSDMTRPSGTIQSASLDLASIMKASIAISSENKLEKVLEKLASAILENAGAETAVLMIKYDNREKLLIEAVAKQGREVDVCCSADVDTSSALCLETVNYVVRTKESLVYGCAYEESKLRGGSYLTEHRVKSLLCVPIMYHGVLKAVVYAENNLVEGAFTDDHVAVLKTIATPAAASLENTYTIQHLDELVRTKTSELEITQAKLVENAHKAGMAEIASNVLHNVGNLLNSVITSGRIIEDIAKHSKTSKVLQANNLLEEQMDNIHDFLLNNKKGNLLLNYYLELGKHLEQEQLILLENSTQLLLGATAISSIISAQQNYAYGTSSMIEEVYLEDIVESALVLAASSFSKYGIVIEKKYDPPALVPVQKTKLLHTVINLLKNAKEAMIDTPEEHRKIFIRISNTLSDVSLKIADTGSGVREEDQSKLFTFGYTTKEKGHGSGLHSSAIYINEMGGRIWAESEGVGKGTTMCISLLRKEDLQDEEYKSRVVSK